MDFHKLSTRPARYGFIRAVRADLPGMVACVIAAGFLALATRFAGPVTEALGWVTP